MLVESLLYVGGVLVVLGSLFALLAAIGVIRFPDLYSRMHAASKAGSVGCGLVLLSIALVSFDLSIALRAVLGLAFLLLTTPVAAHLLARASLQSGAGGSVRTVTNELASENKSQL